LVGQGTVQSFEGDLDDYQRYLLDLAQQRRESAAGATGMAAAATTQAAKPLSGGALRKQQQAQRQQYLQQRRPWQKQLEQAEADMVALGAEKSKLEERLCQPMPADEIAAAGKQLKTVQQQLDEAEERWLQASSELEALEQQQERALDQSAGQA
ncbi:MAG: ABC transporter, partial [Brachymonas sp.]|nr:ABC transporter [Brachymonas sp.]